MLTVAALEANGPYELRITDVEYVNRLGLWVDGERWFSEHKATLLRAAAFQYVLSAYSAFELLIANLVLFFYINSKSDEEPPETGMQFLWDKSRRKRFLADKRIADIESEDWMKRNHRFEEVKTRVSLLEEVCGLALRSFSMKSDRSEFGWNQFLDYRILRHSIAHNSGRQTLHSGRGLEKRDVTKSHVLLLDSYLTGLINHVNEHLYTTSVIKYVHRELLDRGK